MFTPYVSHVTCHTSHVMCQVSLIRCHEAGVTCPVSHFFLTYGRIQQVEGVLSSVPTPSSFPIRPSEKITVCQNQATAKLCIISHITFRLGQSNVFFRTLQYFRVFNPQKENFKDILLIKRLLPNKLDVYLTVYQQAFLQSVFVLFNTKCLVKGLLSQQLCRISYTLIS